MTEQLWVQVDVVFLVRSLKVHRRRRACINSVLEHFENVHEFSLLASNFGVFFIWMYENLIFSWKRFYLRCCTQIDRLTEFYPFFLLEIQSEAYPKIRKKVKIFQWDCLHCIMPPHRIVQLNLDKLSVGLQHKGITWLESEILRENETQNEPSTVVQKDRSVYTEGPQ